MSLKREHMLTHGNRLQSRIQARGGGEGGMSDRELVLSVTKVASCVGDGRRISPDGAGVTAEEFEHLSVHPAISPHLLGCLSQGLP